MKNNFFKESKTEREGERGQSEREKKKTETDNRKGTRKK